jgi:hypothetical protein
MLDRGEELKQLRKESSMFTRGAVGKRTLGQYGREFVKPAGGPGGVTGKPQLLDLSTRDGMNNSLDNRDNLPLWAAAEGPPWDCNVIGKPVLGN